MNDSSLLETTGEISVAFAGFISMFLVLATRDGRFPLDVAFPIRVIVAGSITPVFYAVFPLLLHSLGRPAPALWRISSGLTLVIGALVSLLMLRQLRVLTGKNRNLGTGFVAVFSGALGVGHYICLIGNILAWPCVPSGGVYLLAAWSNIAIAGVTFANLIFTNVLAE